MEAKRDFLRNIKKSNFRRKWFYFLVLFSTVKEFAGIVFFCTQWLTDLIPRQKVTSRLTF